MVFVSILHWIKTFTEEAGIFLNKYLAFLATTKIYKSFILFCAPKRKKLLYKTALTGCQTFKMPKKVLRNVISEFYYSK